MRSHATDTAPPVRERVDELALFSGAPAFAEPLHVGRPNIGDRAAFLARIEEALDRRWLTNHGALSLELERRVADLAGVRYAVVVANATLGIELLVRALALEGEVIVPAWTFVGTAQALSWVGLTPVFCDVDPVTQTLAPDAVEAAVTPRTSAILGVHLWGRTCEVERLQSIAHAHGLELVFDAAHALGCTRRGKPVGGFGRAEVLSFHATKVASAAEGGAITTDDARLAERLRYTRAFGFTDYDSGLHSARTPR
jgi:dTDP-4-amino-4,6-dideoxyglucose